MTAPMIEAPVRRAPVVVDVPLSSAKPTPDVSAEQRRQRWVVGYTTPVADRRHARRLARGKRLRLISQLVPSGDWVGHDGIRWDTIRDAERHRQVTNGRTVYRVVST